MLFEEMNQIPVDVLKMYRPQNWPEMADLAWWNEACDALAIYQPPPASLKLGNKDRKWELVSAYQKTVRRGNVELALKLASAMASMPEELPYFWRRVCVTACEDVGPADTQVMNMVIACSAVYTPKKAATHQYKVLCWLTELMCATDRSRGYCMLANIENLIAEGVKPSVMSETQKDLMPRLKKVDFGLHWAQTNNWRGEGLLKYQLITDIDHMEEQEATVLPAPDLLKGLPSYAYDMHTRVGKKALTMLTGFQVVKNFFAENPTVKPKQEALGWALFFAEGCLIQGEWYNEEVAWMEQRYAAARFGWSLDIWYDIIAIVHKLVEDGAIDKLREKALSEAGY